VVQLLPTQTPVGPRSLCLNNPTGISYQTPSTPGSVYTWTVIGGTVTSANPTTNQITIDWTTAGTGAIVVTETSTTSLASCFGTSDTLYVTILPSPDTTLAIQGATAVCEGTSNSVYTLNGLSGSTYTWELDGTQISTGSSNSVSLNWATAGNYVVTVTETSAQGCAGIPISLNVTVNPTPTAATVSGPAFVCPQSMMNLKYVAKGNINSTYNWRVTGGVVSAVVADTAFISFDGTASPRVFVTETSAAGCKGTEITYPVEVDDAEVQLSIVSTEETNDGNIILSFFMTSNGVNSKPISIFRRDSGNGNWTKLADVPNTATTYTDNQVDTDMQVYEYKLETSNECGNILTSNIHSGIYLQGASAEESGMVNLFWSKYKGWSNTITYEIYRKLDNGTYEQVGNTSDSTFSLNSGRSGFNQCFRIKAVESGNNNRVSWSNDICFNFENKIYIYNIITPNNDFKNDAFVIENVELYDGNELAIFNRWGAEVYRKRNYDNSWSAEGVADGTYFYILTLKDGTAYKGWVEVVR
ncbi:MAG: gliding motility-associated C-terminal domain-containing protein, partial [Hymenobacteraceae bacterium]|nr:gliding motility-associated C-terminal domain-containing protein [Hymenobacteraceae bacterium]